MAAIAARYARAFAEVAEQQKLDPDKSVQDLDALAALFAESRELHEVFMNPAVPHPEKIKLLDAIIQRTGGSKFLRNFVAVMVDQQRIGMIGEIAREFRHQLDERVGIADAQVSAARALTADEKRVLEQQLASVTGKRIRARYSEDPGLLGGVKVRVGSTIYDGSVRSRLRRIREQITGA